MDLALPSSSLLFEIAINYQIKDVALLYVIQLY